MPPDVLSVEAFSGEDPTRRIGSFELFTSFRCRLSLLDPSEASFEMGDEETYDQLNDFVGLGALFRVALNDRPLLTGRVEVSRIPNDAMRGTEMQWVVRTLLANARFTSADPKIRVQDQTLKDVLLAVFQRLGLSEKDFVFRGDVARDLLTGKPAKGTKNAPDIDAIAVDQAKVRPPETIWEFAERHVRRHGLMMWDSPDGRVVVAAPDDQQQPLYHLRMLRPPDSAYNNLLSAERIRDVSEAASRLSVFGAGSKDDKGRVRYILDDDFVTQLGFDRQVIVLDEGIKTAERAERRAKQERALRNRRLDAWQLVVQGLSYSDGDVEGMPFAIDTMVDLIVTTTGGAVGAYHVDVVELARDAQAADTCALSVVAPGVWSL